MNVVLTAPIPGISTPSFPFGGAILAGLRIQFPPDYFCRISMMRHPAAFCKSIQSLIFVYLKNARGATDSYAVAYLSFTIARPMECNLQGVPSNARASERKTGA
jgi:hypothetical protein